MITKTQRNKLKKYLKRGYVSEVLLELNRKKILNTKGKPHSESIIRNVFNGLQSNPDIEDAFLVVYSNRKTEFEKIEKKKNKLLSA